MIQEPATNSEAPPPSPEAPAEQEFANGHQNDFEIVTRSVTLKNIKWFGLISVCLIMTAVYYSVDIPAALHQELKDYLAGSSEKELSNFELYFNLLYTVYSIPNMVLPLLGGVFVDRFGPAQCMVAYAICLWLGQILFAVGLSQKSWIIMLLGRIAYGLGGEIICVANSTLISEWFDPTERSFAFGTLLAISRLGSVLNNMVSPKLAHSLATPWALWAGVVMNTGGVFSALYVRYLDGRSRKSNQTRSSGQATSDDIAREDNGLSEPLLRRESDDQVGNTVDSEIEDTESFEDEIQEDEGIQCSDVARLSPVFWLLCICCMVVYGCIMPFNNVASGILLERNYFRPPPTDCVLKWPEQCTAGKLVNYSNPSTDAEGNSCPGKNYAPILPTFPFNASTDDGGYILYDSADCDKRFWSDDCTKDYCSAQKKATEIAGRVMSIPYAVSALLSPPVGGVVDRIGRRASLAFLTSLALMAVHIVLGLFHAIPPWMPLLVQGVAYALFSAVIWPSVAMVVEKKVTGTAYGIILSLQNTGLALFPLLVAAIYNASHQSYIPNVELLFASCAGIGSLAGMLMYVLDARNGYKLQSVDGQGIVNRNTENSRPSSNRMTE